MEPIRETIIHVIKNLLVKNAGVKEGDPQLWLKKFLTKKELEHIKVSYFKKGVLNINVDSSAWLYNLSLKKEALLSSLKEEQRSVKEIRLHLGEVK